jgi:hypothetical protein
MVLSTRLELMRRGVRLEAGWETRFGKVRKGGLFSGGVSREISNLRRSERLRQ